MADSISSGAKLGRYEIRSKLGAGGMGEVYLAEDAQVHRKVALKVLPAEVSANQDRMRRFIQEAHAAADGKDYIYFDSRADVDNIWIQPVAGGAAKQLTRFGSDFIDHFDVSRDGKRFIVSRATGANDIILIKNFQ